MSEQTPYIDSFPDQKFANNPESRCPCVLLLDISGSMDGAPIEALNAGLMTFRDELVRDSLTAKRVEVAVISFGGQVSTVVAFTTADQFQPPTLSADGDTPMGAAIECAVDLVDQEKLKYRANGVAYYRPWIFMITDGQPTDQERWRIAAQKIKEGEAAEKFAFFCVGVQGANLDILEQIAVRPPLMLDGLKFRELFVWLSASQRRVSSTAVGGEVKLPDPKGAGWTAV